MKDQKKITFQRRVAAELKLEVNFIEGRLQDFKSQKII